MFILLVKKWSGDARKKFLYWVVKIGVNIRKRGLKMTRSETLDWGKIFDLDILAIWSAIALTLIMLKVYGVF